MFLVGDKMNAMKIPVLVVFVSFFLAGCGADQANDVTTAKDSEIEKSTPALIQKPSSNNYDGTVAKPGSPYAISYRIVGTPIVGSPVTVDLHITSALESRPMTLDYRINDATAMMFAESQPTKVRMELADNEAAYQQRVTVIPQREGRFYLNVSASFDSDTGTVSTGMAIPIQVGTGTREMQEHGELQQDENGEAVRVLTSE